MPGDALRNWRAAGKWQQAVRLADGQERSDLEWLQPFVRRCRKHAVEQPWNGSRLRICQSAARRIYRTLGAEHVRHRRPAAPDVVLRRLLSLDYVLEHPHAAWLPTEYEKVTALTAAGIARELLPRRLYQGAVGAQHRYFPEDYIE